MLTATYLVVLFSVIALAAAQRGGRLIAEEFSRIAVYAALAGNVLVAVTKFVAAVMTGSSAMAARRCTAWMIRATNCCCSTDSTAPPSPPTRHTRSATAAELYFWSFIVAVLVFVLGAGVSIHEGVLHVRYPGPITDVKVSFIVLGLAFVFEAGSSWFGFRSFQEG